MREPDKRSESSNRDAHECPPMGAWELVSDPFESPKVYRHKTPLITETERGKKVYLFAVNKRGVPPIILHDMGENLSQPELRFLIDNEPVEVGCVGRVPPKNTEGFLDLATEANEWTSYRYGMKNLERIPADATSIPFRLKSPESVKPIADRSPKRPNYSLFVSPPPVPTLRGVIEGPTLLALRQAIQLTAFFNQ